MKVALPNSFYRFRDSLQRANNLQKPFLKTKLLIPFFIIILPILGYWTYCSYLKPISPYYQDYDPEFQYFLNSLAILRGGSYTYIDHPGTPLEIVGSILLLATRPFISNYPGGFAMYHLEHPGLFLGLARGLIALASVGSALSFFGTVDFFGKLKNTLIAACLPMMFFIVHPNAYSTLITWSHNSFNFALGTLLLILLYRMTKQDQVIEAWKIVGLGLGVGLLASITIYFIAWAAGALITTVVFYRLQRVSWKKTMMTEFALVISIGLGFFISTIPILPLYPQFMDWLTRIAFHEGIYGTGLPGITTPGLMASNFLTLFHDLPILFITLGIELSLLLIGLLGSAKGTKLRPGVVAITAGLIPQLLIEFVMILKHPKDIYMLAIAAMIPLFMLVVLEIFQAHTFLSRILHPALILVLVIGLVVSTYNSLVSYRDYADSINNTVAQTSQAIQEYSSLTNKSQNVLSVFWTYGTFSSCQSLQYGDNRTSPEIVEDIKEICGTYRMISLWANTSDVFKRKWDLVVTRKSFLTDYPLLFNNIGRLYKELPETTNEYGPVVILSHAP